MSLAERIGIVLLGLVLFLPGIGRRDLWNPDEPRYAEVAREMRLTGDWLVPHLNGAIYAEKPPLLFWSIAGFSFLTGGVDEVSARLPSLLAAIAALALTFSIARRLFDRQVAWWAALVFGTSGRILWQGRVGQIDMLLLALVAFAMYFFVRGWTEQRPGFHRLFFVAAGLATLAKGPVGLLPPLLSIVAFAWATGERRRLREMKIGTGLLIWAGIALAWLVPAAISGGEAYLRTILLKQNVQRFADPWHHFNPPWYYLTTIPADFFPWTLFLPAALWLGWRRSTGNERRGYLFALSWILVTVVFFSISPAKRTLYVLQMFPALALVVAWMFGEVARSRGHLRRWVSLPALLYAVALGAVPLILPRLAEKQRELATLGSGFLVLVAAIVLFVAATAAVAWAAAVAEKTGLVVQSLAAGTAAAAIAGSLFLLPRFDPVKSFRPIAETFVASSSGAPYAIYRRLEAPILFYTRRFAALPQDEAELGRWIAEREREGRAWLFIERRELEALASPPPLVEVASSADRGKNYLLLASPEASESPGPAGPAPGSASPAGPPSSAPSPSGLDQVR